MIHHEDGILIVILRIGTENNNTLNDLAVVQASQKYFEQKIMLVHCIRSIVQRQMPWYKERL